MTHHPHAITPMSLFRGFAWVAALEFSGATWADQPTLAPGHQTKAARAAFESKLICKREYVTGSFVPRRICKTQAQIDKEHATSKQWMEDSNRNSSWSVIQSDR
jgi:hypothetical protein